MPPVSAAPYVSGSVGWASLTNSDTTYGGITNSNMITYKSGVPFGGAIGIRNDAYRFEAALDYQSNVVDTVKRAGVPMTIPGHSVSSLSYMLNCYYDFTIKGSGVSPYLTAGIGGANLTEKGGKTPDETSTGFAWKLGTGLGVKASENIVVDLGYRYFKPSSYYANGATDITALSHNVLVGVRYCF